MQVCVSADELAGRQSSDNKHMIQAARSREAIPSCNAADLPFTTHRAIETTLCCEIHQPKPPSCRCRI